MRDYRATGCATMPDMKYVDAVMAFLCASNFVVSSIHTVLLFNAP